MKPLFLAIEGVNSFEKRQAVDFSALSEYGLFGIFGPTGSGKSSILDAMTLALYGQIARFPGNKLMFFNANSEKAEVIFRFETYSGVYCVQRTYKKKKNKKNDEQANIYTGLGYKSSSVRFYRIIGETEEILSDKSDSEATRAVTETIGLSYDDFTRSVVLPQGHFSDFLLLTSSKRREMLERIFKLEKYGDRLYGKIREKVNANKNKLDVLSQTLKSYEYCDQNALDAIERVLAETHSAHKQFLHKKEVLSNDVDKYRSLTVIYNEYVAATNRHKSLEKCVHEFDKKREKLTVSRKAAILTSIVTEVENTKNRIFDIEKEAKKLEKKAEKARINYESAKAAHEKAYNNKEQSMPEIIKKENNAASAIQLQSEYDDATLELDELKQLFRVKQEALKNNQSEIELIIEKQKNLDNTLLLCTDQKKAVSYLLSDRKIAHEGLMLEEKIAYIQNELAKKKKREKQLSGTLLLGEKKLMSEFALLESDKNNGVQKSEAVSSIINKIEKIEQNIQAQSAYMLSQMLISGEPCSVCGSIVHPSTAQLPKNEIVSIDDLKKLKEQKKVAEKEFESAKIAIHEREISLAALKQTTDNDRTAFEELSIETASFQTDTDKLVISLNEYKKQLSIDISFLEYVKTLDEKDRLREEIDIKETHARTKQKSVIEQKEKMQSALYCLEQEANNIKIQGKEKRLVWDQKKQKINELTNGLPLADFMAQTEKLKISVVTEEEHTKKNYEAADDVFRQYADMQAANTTTYLNLNEILSEQEKKLRHQLQIHGFADVSDVMSAYLDENSINMLDTSIREFDKEINIVTNTINGLLEKMDGEVIENIPHRFEQFKKAYDDNATKISECESVTAVNLEKKRNMENDLQVKNKLISDKLETEKQGGYMTELASLCRNNAFLAYIAKRQLRYVTLEATKRLKKMTHGRYAMELDSSEFVIRDDFNGGVRRAPASLSGGETFMVSLCLALALSSQIQMQSHADLQFFFLDEGFGSLDSVLVNTVMDALETLRREHMSVGLITHVEELKTRIPVKLIVEPARQGLNGSLVRMEQ